MKYTIFLMIFFISSNVFSSELNVKFRTSSYVTDDDIYRRGDGKGLQLDYVADDGFYVFGSVDTVAVYAVDKAFDYTMLGVGVGNKINITKNVRLFGQVGYYSISNSWGAKKREFNEALLYYLNERYGVYSNNENHYTEFDSYEVENDDAIGGTIGIEMVRNFTKNLSSTFSLSYRLLKIKERFIGYRDDWDLEVNHNWQTGGMRDYSSINFSMGINYVF